MMHECTCNPGFMRDTLIPQVGIITDIREETPDVKTFRVNAPGGGKLFEHIILQNGSGRIRRRTISPAVRTEYRFLSRTGSADETRSLKASCPAAARCLEYPPAANQAANQAPAPRSADRAYTDGGGM